ncbi:MAG: hypothetical protein KC431_05565 [Myxococcales bacterium]|nr:hypothetical protein [Myxococcales bacterium]
MQFDFNLSTIHPHHLVRPSTRAIRISMQPRLEQQNEQLEKQAEKQLEALLEALLARESSNAPHDTLSRGRLTHAPPQNKLTVLVLALTLTLITNIAHIAIQYAYAGLHQPEDTKLNEMSRDSGPDDAPASSPPSPACSILAGDESGKRDQTFDHPLLYISYPAPHTLRVTKWPSQCGSMSAREIPA